MKKYKHGNILGIKEHLLLGKPITRLEAMLLYGISDLTKPISQIRREGWIIKSRKLPYARAVKRVNEYAVCKPPKNLPTHEIQVIEYWLSK
tara:strand:+ start:70 stop:342 length:273 start_codon:yes stop_codon:yes gene_type:complete